MANDELMDDVVLHGLLSDREVTVIVLQPASLGLRGSKDKGCDDGWDPAIAKVKDGELSDALHDDDVGQEEEEEKMVALEQVMSSAVFFRAWKSSVIWEFLPRSWLGSSGASSPINRGFMNLHTKSMSG